MSTIFNEYSPELLWCDVGDVGGPSSPPELASRWLNTARKNNTPVGFNNSCIMTIKGDILTPEYAAVSTLNPRHWEAIRGLDAYSYGYNAASRDAAYMNASTIITTLVDTVAKNGNFLLGIGLKADRSFPDVSINRLLDAGAWIKSHAESIYDTKYWPSGPGSGDMRYTTTDDTFYIHMLRRPNSTTTITDPIPYLETDTLVVAGGDMDGVEFDARLENGRVIVSVPTEVADADKYVWTLKFEY
jgi:alpha-L-fucosidase